MYSCCWFSSTTRVTSSYIGRRAYGQVALRLSGYYRAILVFGWIELKRNILNFPSGIVKHATLRPCFYSFFFFFCRTVSSDGFTRLHGGGPGIIKIMYNLQPPFLSPRVAPPRTKSNAAAVHIIVYVKLAPG